MSKKPAKPVTKRINVGVAALARETGLAEATISKKLKRGMPANQIRAAAARRKGQAPTKPQKPAKPYTPGRGRPPVTGEYEVAVERQQRYSAMEEMKYRRQKALAERQELENALRRGELLPVAYARTWGVRFLVSGRDELLKGPSELADGLAAESDPLKVATILRAWVERVIGKFGQLEELWKGNLENEQVA